VAAAGLPPYGTRQRPSARADDSETLRGPAGDLRLDAESLVPCPERSRRTERGSREAARGIPRAYVGMTERLGRERWFLARTRATD
jgi:hypothetical protein